MVGAFRKSRLAMGAVLVLTACVTVAIWVRDAGKPLYIPLVASVLMVAIGCLSARLLGNLVASGQNTNTLGILHMELDPEKFLECYRDVPGKLREGSRDRAIASAYLADGYAAAGDYAMAIQALGAPYPGRQDAALLGVYYGNLSRYALGSGDMELADSAMQELAQIIDGQCGDKPQLKKNLLSTQGLLRQRRRAMQGEAVDREWLEEQLPAAGYHLRTLEILEILALDAKNRGDGKTLEKYRTQLCQQGGKTVYHRNAKSRA